MKTTINNWTTMFSYLYREFLAFLIFDDQATLYSIFMQRTSTVLKEKNVWKFRGFFTIS